MKKRKFFRSNEILDDENINEENIEVEPKRKGMIIEQKWYNMAMIVVIAFLLLFGTFAPVSEKWAYTSEIIAYVVGVVDIIGEIIYKKKNWYTLYNKVMVLCSSGIFFLAGHRVTAIMILLVYLVCRSGVRFFAARENKIFDSLHSLLPEKAKIYVEGVETLMPAKAIKTGNVVKVEMGDIIPGDGVVFEGKATIDESILSEAGQVRRTVKEDDEVMAGCKVLSGKLQIVMSVSYEESYMAQSIDSVDKVMGEEETFSDRYKKMTQIYLIVMWILIVVVVGIGVFTDNFEYWALRGNVLLLSTTLGSLRGAWQMAVNYYILNSFEKGIIFKEKRVVEDLEKMDLVLIDDVITTGIKEYSLSHIVNMDCTKQEIMTYAGYLEYYSRNPIGRLIYDGFMQVAKYEGLDEGDVIHPELISKFEEFEGKGVSGYLGEMFICVGNKKMMQLINLRDLPTEEDKELVYVAINQKLLGYIAIDVTFKGADNKFAEEWGKVDIEKIALFNKKEGDYQEILKEMMAEKKKDSKIAAVTREPEYIKSMAGADFTILLDARGKNNVEGDLHIPNKDLVEISELKMDLQGAASMARLKCKGYAAAKIAFYGAAFFGLVPAWVPFVAEMLAVILLSIPGDVKNASTDA